MPHSNGRIYTEPNVDSTKPDWGADLTGDVAAVLNVNSGDTGTLCSHTNINMWARYKPETAVTGLTSFGITPITLQQRTLNSFSIETKVNAGVGSVSTLVDRLRAGTQQDCFIYKKPFGTPASPYRISDFNNYWHNAPCPIRAPYNTTDTLGVTSQGKLQLYYYVDVTGSDYGLGLKDLRFQNDAQQLSSYYFGILIYNNSTYAAATQDHVMGTEQQEGLDVTLTGVPQTTATYTMVPFFSTQPIASANDSFVGTIYPMIWASQNINVVAESQYIQIDTWAFVWDNDMQTVRFKYSVVNRTSGAQTFNTEAFGPSTSYIEVGDPVLTQASYERWPVRVNVSVPAGEEVSGEVVIASNLTNDKVSLISTADSKFYIQAHQFNGQYVNSGVIAIWPHEDI